MVELRPEAWVPSVTPLVSPGTSATSALSEDKETCPAHSGVCDKDQMGVKMHFFIHISHRRGSPPQHYRCFELGDSWLGGVGAGPGVVESLLLNASGITKCAKHPWR